MDSGHLDPMRGVRRIREHIHQPHPEPQPEKPADDKPAR